MRALGRLLWCLVALVCAGALTSEAAAQPAAPPTTSVSIRGQVATPVSDTLTRPAAGVWVTLHRVAPGDAGPLDSARTDAAGSYRIDYRRAATDSAVFFLSASYAGITYFSAPLGDGNVDGVDAEIIVYDTASVATPLGVHGRHVIVGSLDSTRRHPVVELYEIVNDSLVTFVASEERPTFTTSVPAGAQDFRLTSGDISPDAVTIADGQVSVLAPIPPGVKQFGIAYSLPPTRFPLSLPVGRELDELEVLVEDSAGTADGARLVETEAVSADGRTFRRFVADSVPAAGVFRITVPPPPGESRGLYVTGVLLLVGTLMLLAFSRSVRRPAPTPLGWNGAAGPDPDELARRIAALDASFQRRRNPTAAERAEYERTRGGLKAMLADALARPAVEP